jgi:hypothetical protein
MGDIAEFLRNETIKVPSLMRILSTQNLHRKKARFLLVDVVKTNYKNTLGKIIATTPFSISADEVTDLCGFRYLGICVHFWENKILMNKLWSLIPLGIDTSSFAIFKIIETEILEKYGRNLIGFITDGAFVSKGHLKGVQKLIMDKIPGLVCIHCLAHCLDLIAKKAYNQIELEIDIFITKITNYFKNSSINKSKFLEFQKILKLDPLNTLPLCRTRWIKLHKFIQRTLSLWDRLTTYFEGKYLNSSILLKDTNYLYNLENISETSLTRKLASDFNNFNYCFLKRRFNGT